MPFDSNDPKLTEEMIEAINHSAKDLGLRLEGKFRFGWHNKSIGSAAVRHNQKLWLRVHCEKPDANNYRISEGLEEAQVLEDVRCVQIIESKIWASPTAKWQADLMFFITSPICSGTPIAQSNIPVKDEWLQELKRTLEKLSTQKTDRVAVRQQQISESIAERFGEGIPTKIETWQTVHADLHWANLTFPELYLFDWEDWGRGPAGLDAATLYCFSLTQPNLAARVYEVFKNPLESPDGKISQLYVASELLKMIELYHDHPNLEKPLRALAKSLL